MALLKRKEDSGSSIPLTRWLAVQVSFGCFLYVLKQAAVPTVMPRTGSSAPDSAIKLPSRTCSVHSAGPATEGEDRNLDLIPS